MGTSRHAAAQLFVERATYTLQLPQELSLWGSTRRYTGPFSIGKQSCRVHSLMHSVPDWSRSCTRYNTTECHIANSNADACRAGRTTSLELSEVHASTCIHIRLAYFSQGKYN